MSLYVGKFGNFYASNSALSKEEQKVNATYIYKGMSTYGWTLNAICGMLGNMQTESTINPARWQGGVVKDSKGYGLVQWTPSTNFRSWSKSTNENELMDEEIARIKWEHDNGKQFYKTSDYPLTFKQFVVSKESAYYLGRVFGRNYERSSAILSGGDAAEKSLNTRGNYATAWYDYLKDIKIGDEIVNEETEVIEEKPNSSEMTEDDQILYFIREQDDELYRLGANGEDDWDCSGLTMESVRPLGYEWYHGATTQYDRGFKSGVANKYGYWKNSGTISSMPKDELLFLFNRSKKDSSKMEHTGVYDPKTGNELQSGGYGEIITISINNQEQIEKYGIDVVRKLNGKRKSIVSEQKFNKLHWTHWCTLKSLNSSDNSGNNSETNTNYPTLKKGSSGEFVKKLQELLNEKSNSNLIVDGKFGKSTKAAVEKYQGENNLVVDAICGKNTWSKLLEKEVSAEIEEPKDIRKVTSKNVPLNVRIGAGLDYEDIGDLHYGETVVVLKDVGTWSEIEWKGDTAWCSNKYLEKV
jgi:hypothetical protein